MAYGKFNSVNLKLFIFSFTVGTVGALVACSGGSGDDSTTPGYTISGGQCTNSAGSYVASQLCTQTTAYNSSLFQPNGTQCLNIANPQEPQVVNNAYCSSDPFEWQNGTTTCFDTIAQAPTASIYCVPANEPYYMAGGICYVSGTQLPFVGNGNNLQPCLQEQNPIDYSCDLNGGVFNVYSGGQWTQVVCGYGEPGCAGLIVYMSNSSAAYLCD